MKKEWSDGETHQGEEVKMQLYRSTTPPASKTETGEKYNIGVYYTGPNSENYSHGNTNDSVIKDGLTYWKITKGTVNTQSANLIIGDIGNADINRLDLTCSDPNVFILITDAQEVIGQGFTRPILPIEVTNQMKAQSTIAQDATHTVTDSK